MQHIKIQIEDDVAEKLDRLAAERHVTVDDFVEAELIALISREQARKRLRELVETSPLSLEPGWKWNREELYDRPMLRGYKRPPVRSDSAAE